jgi:hypothetical protein
MRTDPKAASAAALALALAGCGSSHHAATSASRTSATTSAGSPATAQSLVVTVTTPKSEPVAGGFWPIVVRAHDPTGGPVNGTVSYAFLFGGAVVARRPGGHMTDGVFHDRLEFPAQSVGYPLTVRTLVQQASGASGTTERTVTVQR